MPTEYFYWNVDPEIINLFGISIRYYGLLFVSGLLLCMYFLQRIFKTENIPLESLERLSIYGMIGIFAGARLGHCLFYEPSYYFAHPLEMFLPIQPLPGGGYRFSGYQGLASHGGTLGIIIALIIYCRKTKQSLIKIIDLISIVAPLEGCFIRLGNLMNSEIIGMASTKPWAFIFARVDNIPRHPTPLYEALSYFVIFLLLLMLYKHYRLKLQNGFFFGLSLSLVFIARFLIEFLKERQVDFEEYMAIDMGQILSIPYIIIGFGFIYYGLIKTRKILNEENGR
jgi:phosphatidylglycerol:prolipoprotein diacylglycerol transferase